MNILKFLIITSLIFLNLDYAEAKGIPYCSKKVTRGCVKPKRGQTAKHYFAPKYKESSLAKTKSKKIAKHTTNKKLKKSKRGTASVLELKLNKKKKTR